MPSNPAACASKRKRTTDPHESSPQDVIPGLLDDIVVTHVLRSEYFDDPVDLARLRRVSRAMRDAVTATGLRFKKMEVNEAVELGCLKRLQREGRLSCQEYLCQAAAGSGQLEELKTLRAARR